MAVSVETIDGTRIRYWRESGWRKGIWWVFQVVSDVPSEKDIFLGRIDRERRAFKSGYKWNGKDSRREAAEELLRQGLGN